MFNSKKVESLENKLNSLQERFNTLLNNHVSEIIYNQDGMMDTLGLLLKETTKNNDTLTYILKNMQGLDKLSFTQIEEPFSEEAKSKRNSTNVYNSFVSVKIPTSIMEYLLDKSKSGKKSPALKRVFNRNGKLVFCPISIDVADKINTTYLAKNSSNIVTYERCTISVSEEMYVTFNKIAKILNLKLIDVVSAFIYTSSTQEYARIKEAFNVLQTEEEFKKNK
jgi:hypothetical protein